MVTLISKRRLTIARERCSTAKAYQMTLKSYKMRWGFTLHRSAEDTESYKQPLKLA